MIPSKKSINYFLIVNAERWRLLKDEFLIKLQAIKEILLVFDFQLEKEKNSDRFVII